MQLANCFDWSHLKELYQLFLYLPELFVFALAIEGQSPSVLFSLKRILWNLSSQQVVGKSDNCCSFLLESHREVGVIMGLLCGIARSAGALFMHAHNICKKKKAQKGYRKDGIDTLIYLVATSWTAP